MKILDVHPFQHGLRRNIMMLDRLGNEMETIHQAVQGLVAMEDVLKGEGGNAIRAFYADCHLPFLQFFMLFQGRFTTVLNQMVAALDTLEPDTSGYIREHFLEVDIEQGLQHIAQLTGSLTDEANSIMKEVADIVSLPHLDDSEVQYGVRDATIKRDDTVTQLHEFDANQTTALSPIAQDLLTMETWISDIESMFQEGLTDIYFPADQWAALSSRNTLKTDLVQHTAAMAGLPIMMGMNGQSTTMLGALLAGENPLKFSYGFVDRPSTLNGASILTLPGMATYARPMDWSNDPNTISYEMYSENVCTDLTPTPTPNAFKKSLNSFKEIGTDYWAGLQTRYDKANDSLYDFANYATLGASDALISGAKSRASKLADSPEDFVNYATMGITGMVKEAVMPEDPFSKEHWENSFGVASLAVGGVKGVGSKGSVGTVGGKETGQIQGQAKAPEVNFAKEVSEANNVIEVNRRFTPFTPGPLKDSIAETFTGGVYTKKNLTEDTVMYRVSGGKAGEIGSYLSRTEQKGSLQSQIDLALNPEWGNSATKITVVKVPKGTIIYEGTAEPQIINGGTGTLLGGGNQIYIPEVKAEWFGN